MDGWLNTEEFAELLGIGIARAKQILAVEVQHERAQRVGKRAFVISQARADEIKTARAAYTGAGRKPKRGPKRRE